MFSILKIILSIAFVIHIFGSLVLNDLAYMCITLIIIVITVINVAKKYCELNKDFNICILGVNIYNTNNLIPIPFFISYLISSQHNISFAFGAYTMSLIALYLSFVRFKIKKNDS